MRNKWVYNLCISAMLIAVGMFLPFLTGQIREIGKMLLPMHLPVMLCGFICGWKYGGAVGFLLPLVRSLSFGMPVLFPNAAAMSFELATYGIVCGLVYMLFKKKSALAIYTSLLSAMIIGRAVWGGVSALFYGIADKGYTVSMFIAGAILDAIPGVILQLILVPTLVFALEKTKRQPKSF